MKTIAYDNDTKWMYFSIKNAELLEKHNDIWSKVINIIKIEFDSKPIDNKFFLKSKIDFHDKEMRKVDSNILVYQ